MFAATGTRFYPVTDSLKRFLNNYDAARNFRRRSIVTAANIAKPSKAKLMRLQMV